MVLGTPDFVPTSDARIYDALGRSIAASGDYPVFGDPGRRVRDVAWPPGYPAFLGVVYRLSGQSLKPTSTSGGAVLARWEIARLVQAVMGTLAVALIGVVARQLWGPRAGLLALGLAAVYAPLVMLSATLMTEGQLVCLELGALASVLAARGSPRRQRWLIASGVLVGLAALTHDNGLVLVLPLAVAAWWPGRSRATARGAALLLCAALLTVTPWTIRNAIVADGFVLISAHGGKTLAGNYNRVAEHARAGPWTWRSPTRVRALRRVLARYPWNRDPAGRDAALAQEGWRFVREHPDAVPASVGVHTLRMFGVGGLKREFIALQDLGMPLSRLAVYWCWAMGALAVIGLLTPAARRAPPWLWLTPLLLWVSAAVVVGAVRFRAPIDPFVVLAATLAVDAVVRTARRGGPAITGGGRSTS